MPKQEKHQNDEKIKSSSETLSVVMSHSEKIEGNWGWIPRSVEPTVEKWLNTKGSVVLIRGQRRSGKSSTVKYCARKLRKTLITLYCAKDCNALVKNARKTFENEKITCLSDIRLAILASIKSGKVVLLEEIQNSSNAFQVTLQQTCDDMSFETMYSPTEWAGAGSLFMMGSLPSLVDSIIENRKNPLFQRISAKITIYRMNTLEITYMFLSNLNITDPELKLSLYSIFGGKPHPYEVGHRAGLFQGDQTVVETVGCKYLSTELQSNFNDASDLCRIEFGDKLSQALKAVARYKTLADQTKAIKNDHAFSLLLDDLYMRYGVIEPVYFVHELHKFKIARFDFAEPLLQLATSIPKRVNQIRREDDSCDLKIPDEILAQQEAFTWERWVVEIAQDRRRLCMNSCFPFLPNADMCTFCPKLLWSSADVEIDIVAGHPSSNTLILGSCKRSSTKIDNEELLGHVLRLETKEKTAYGNLLKHLSLNPENLRKRYYHFVPRILEGDRNRVNKLEGDHEDVHVVDLDMLLAPFEMQYRAELEKQSKEPQSKEPQSATTSREVTPIPFYLSDESVENTPTTAGLSSKLLHPPPLLLPKGSVTKDTVESLDVTKGWNEVFWSRSVLLSLSVSAVVLSLAWTRNR